MSVTEILESIETLTALERTQVLEELQKQERLTATQSNGISQKKPFKTIFDACPGLIGKHASGLGDLSTNKKYLEGFGEKWGEKANLAERS